MSNLNAGEVNLEELYKLTEVTKPRGKNFHPYGRMCTGCEIVKPWDEFYNFVRGINGHTNKCKPCMHPKKSEVVVVSPEQQRCSTCKQILDLNLFGANKSKLNGKHGICKQCVIVSKQARKVPQTLAPPWSIPFKPKSTSPRGVELEMKSNDSSPSESDPGRSSSRDIPDIVELSPRDELGLSMVQDPVVEMLEEHRIKTYEVIAMNLLSDYLQYVRDHKVSINDSIHMEVAQDLFVQVMRDTLSEYPNWFHPERVSLS